MIVKKPERKKTMSAYFDTINQHYGNFDLSTRILEMIRQAGKDPGNLTRDDLATFDEFHTGGRQSTRELALYAGLKAGMKVLDVGSGVGGPARTLAAEFGCLVTGLDLTEEFCRAAEMLTGLVGLSKSVIFRQGDGLDMPFEDGMFDAVCSQNTIMNIADKEQFFRQVYRVLKPGGVFALESALAGPVPGLHFPTFWAGTPDLNFLLTPQETRALLISTGFVEEVWEDITAMTLEQARRRRERPGAGEKRTLGRSVIVADNVEEKIRNSIRNNEEAHIVTVRAIVRRKE